MRLGEVLGCAGGLPSPAERPVLEPAWAWESGTDFGARPVVRDSLFADDGAFESEDDEPVVPLVSAKARDGIETMAAPTPRATARAPTRPT